MKLRQIREAQKRKNKNNISQMRERLCRLTYLYADGPMIGTAGGRMADDVRHELRLSDIRKIDGMNNHDRKSITPLFGELSAATLIHDDKEKMRVTIGGLLDRAQIDYREEGTTGDLAVSWWFGRMFRDMALKSIHWAILDRQTAFAMTSKYSVLLFQYFASLQNLKHKTDEVFSVPQIRAILGVPKGRLKTWNEMNRYALIPPSGMPDSRWGFPSGPISDSMW